MMSEFLKTESEIKAWLQRHNIQSYKLQRDDQYLFKVNVRGSVSLSHLKLKFIPVKFGTVSHNFSCYENQLTSLEFAPRTVGGDFLCSVNALTSLEHCPLEVGDRFSCSYNLIHSLEFFPQYVKNGFHCHGNPLPESIIKIKNFSELHDIHLIEKEQKQLSQSMAKVKLHTPHSTRNHRL